MDKVDGMDNHDDVITDPNYTLYAYVIYRINLIRSSGICRFIAKPREKKACQVSAGVDTSSLQLQS